MNQRTVCTKENIASVVEFLKCAVEYFKNGGEGCSCYTLNDDFAIYVGWSDGYDANDTGIIKSEPYKSGNREMCYAVNAAVKCRNDYDCADFDYLNFPMYDDGECWDNTVSVSPDMTETDYKDMARWFLKTYVYMVNELNKGKIELC
jgi:hypothetical protein